MSRKRKRLWKDMPPDVHSALDALSPVPPPDPDAWQAGRDAFLENARTFSRRAVTEEPLHRRKEWKITLLFKEVSMVTLVKIILAFGLLVGGTVGTASEVQASLPGEPLYPLKLQWEDWEYARLDDPIEQVQYAMTKTQVRVDEVLALAARGDAIPEQVAMRYQAQLDLALGATELLSGPQRSQMRAHIVEQLSAQEMALSGVDMGRQADDEDPLQMMLASAERTREWVGETVGVDPRPQSPAPTATPHMQEPVPTATPRLQEPVPTATPHMQEPVPTVTPRLQEPVPTATPHLQEPVPTATFNSPPPEPTSTSVPLEPTPTLTPYEYWATPTPTPFLPTPTVTPTYDPYAPTWTPTPTLAPGAPTWTPVPTPAPGDPTWTPTSTSTPVPTFTPTPYFTMTPTPSPVPTSTSTSAPTFTPTP